MLCMTVGSESDGQKEIFEAQNMNADFLPTATLIINWSQWRQVRFCPNLCTYKRYNNDAATGWAIQLHPKIPIFQSASIQMMEWICKRRSYPNLLHRPNQHPKIAAFEILHLCTEWFRPCRCHGNANYLASHDQIDHRYSPMQ